MTETKESKPDMLFSERLEVARQVAKWCDEKALPPTPFNIVTGIQVIGYNIEPKATTAMKE